MWFFFIIDLKLWEPLGQIGLKLPSVLCCLGLKPALAGPCLNDNSSKYYKRCSVKIFLTINLCFITQVVKIAILQVTHFWEKILKHISAKSKTTLQRTIFSQFSRKFAANDFIFVETLDNDNFFIAIFFFFFIHMYIQWFCFP